MMNTLNKQHGTALVTALVLLVALTMVSLAGIQSSSVQLQISGNDEETIQAYEYAQSVVDAVIETPSYFGVGVANGYTICMTDETGCNDTPISLSEDMFTGKTLQAKVTLVKVGPAPRMYNANDLENTTAAYFDVKGRYDETGNNGGKANIVQGMVKVISAGQ
jgi:hypothetical protein